MNRIDQLFESRQRDVLSVYFTAGYPVPDNTPAVLEALQSHGIDMAEIGIPFSDPMADGTVIQQAATQALRNGMSLRRLFAQLRDIRSGIHIPLILMGYLNPIMQYGFEAFCRSCAEVGIDGMIIPDLPFADYMADCKDAAVRHDLKVITLITPETSEERIRLIDMHTSGFIYLVSSAATTGAQQAFDTEQQAYFQRISDMQLRNPLLVGFGISNHATLEAATRHVAGAIVGSRFVQLLGETDSPSAAVEALQTALRQ